MYSQLNRVTGRLVASTHLQSPLFPIKPAQLHKVEVPEIKYTTQHLSVVRDFGSTSTPRRLIPGTNIPFPPVSDAIKEKQELFQKDNDIPVYLKGGVTDVILYRLTLVLCAAGLAGVAHYIITTA